MTAATIGADDMHDHEATPPMRCPSEDELHFWHFCRDPEHLILAMTNSEYTTYRENETLPAWAQNVDARIRSEHVRAGRLITKSFRNSARRGFPVAAMIALSLALFSVAVGLFLRCAWSCIRP